MGWVNGDLYTPAGETVGILPIPDLIRAMTDIQTFNSLPNDKARHTFLAKQQGTRFAIINVHTTKEKLLFKKFMQECISLNGNGSSPDWKHAIQKWNQLANGKTIFYKAFIFISHFFNSFHADGTLIQLIVFCT